MSKKNIKNKPLFKEDSFKRIGLTLRDARRLQNLSIKEVSGQLRISVDYLRKLENGAFFDLPAPAYVNGFLRSYAQYLELVPDALVARYAALSTAENRKTCHKMPMTTRPPQRSAPAVASMLLLFAAIAYGSWFWVKGDTEHSESFVTVTNEIEKPSKRNEMLILDSSIDDKPSLKEAVPTVLAEISQEVTESKIAELKEKNISSAKTNTSILLNDSLDASLKTPNTERSDQFAEIQTLNGPYLDDIKSQNSRTAVANLRDPTQEIVIRAVASSWVEIVRDNGEEVLAKLMQAGDVFVVEGNTSLYLSSGNAGGLTVVVGTDDPIKLGGVGEVIRDLPLVTDELRKVL
ncbi:DUF4115 domain-containing protein [Candidatus Puniceispirillum sp.]|nr:DUF4115 domain-containing protein [Candidatus Puniceispirillum sp.]